MMAIFWIGFGLLSGCHADFTALTDRMTDRAADSA